MLPNAPAEYVSDITIYVNKKTPTGIVVPVVIFKSIPTPAE
jgi:hypothetical protein